MYIAKFRLLGKNLVVEYRNTLTILATKIYRLIKSIKESDVAKGYILRISRLLE